MTPKTTMPNDMRVMLIVLNRQYPCGFQRIPPGQCRGIERKPLMCACTSTDAKHLISHFAFAACRALFVPAHCANAPHGPAQPTARHGALHSPGEARRGTQPGACVYVNAQRTHKQARRGHERGRRGIERGADRGTAGRGGTRRDPAGGGYSRNGRGAHARERRYVTPARTRQFAHFQKSLISHPYFCGQKIWPFLFSGVAHES